MTHSGVVNFYPNFMCFWWANFDLFNGQVFTSFPCNGCLCTSVRISPFQHGSFCTNFAGNSLLRRTLANDESAIEEKFEGLDTFPTVSEGMIFELEFR